MKVWVILFYLYTHFSVNFKCISSLKFLISICLFVSREIPYVKNVILFFSLQKSLSNFCLIQCKLYFFLSQFIHSLFRSQKTVSHYANSQTPIFSPSRSVSSIWVSGVKSEGPTLMSWRHPLNDFRNLFPVRFATVSVLGKPPWKRRWWVLWAIFS